MKIREGYVLNEIADTTVAIYVGDDEANGLKGIVNLNKPGAFMWEKLSAGCTKEELLKAVTEKYDVDASTAMADMEAFLETLREENILVDA